MATDPVCGMNVDERTAAARDDYRDKTYYFCSERCHEAFVATPEKFIEAGALLPDLKPGTNGRDGKP